MSPAIVDFLQEAIGKQITPQHQTIGDSFLLFFRRSALLCAFVTACFFLIACVWLLAGFASSVPLWILVILASVVTCAVTVVLTLNIISRRTYRYERERVQLMLLELRIQKARLDAAYISYRYKIPPEATYPEQTSEIVLQKELETLARRVEELLRLFEETKRLKS